MTGQAHWIDFIPVLLIALMLGIFALRDAADRRKYRVEARRFLCPKTRREVDLVLMRDPGTGAAIGVRSCSAFADPDTVACDKPCLAQLQPHAA